MSGAVWRIRLGAKAKRDFARILKYASEAFGEKQAAFYKTALLETIAKLEGGPEPRGSALRNDIGADLRILYVV